MPYEVYLIFISIRTLNLTKYIYQVTIEKDSPLLLSHAFDSRVNYSSLKIMILKGACSLAVFICAANEIAPLLCKQFSKQFD